MAIDGARDDDDDALERSAAFDELLRSSLNASAEFDASSIPTGVVNVPTAGIIRLLHEVFRTPRRTTAVSTEPMPERVGRFSIHRLLGRGAFGCVYLAHDPILRRQVALKVFHEHLLADESTRRHVLREREIMARLQHPNIVPVWEAGEEDELLFIASEYCPGPTLAQWLADRELRTTESGRAAVFSAESLRQCAGWICRLADAVHHSHERGVVHRDLKPGNVLLEPQGDAQSDEAQTAWRPRLTDFGLAKYFHAVQEETRSGLFVGSLEYASPEQVRGQPDAVGPPSDIYSLGVLLYELLTDEMPHKADSDYDLARKICDEDVVFSPEQRKALPRDLQAITLRALERKPRDRYASAADMRDDLQRFLSSEFVIARPVSVIERSVRFAHRNPGLATLSGLCVCFAMLLVGALVRHNQQLAVHSTKLQQALVDSQHQRSTAHTMQILAQDSERQAREVGYQANMRLAYEAWDKNNLVDVRELLEHVADQAPALCSLDWQLLHQELGARLTSIVRMKEPVYGIAYQPAADSLLSFNESGQVKRWDLKSSTQSDEFQADAGGHAIAVAPDGKTVAIGQRIASRFGPSVLAFWDVEQRKLTKASVHKHSTTLESIEYSLDGKWVASGARYEPVKVSNLETGEAFALPSGRRNTQLAFSPTSDRLAVNSQDSLIEIHDLARLKPPVKIDVSPYRIGSYVWLPGREVIALNARSGWGMQLYSTETGELMAQLPTRHMGESLTVSPDGRYLALGSDEGRVQVFSIAKLKLVKPLGDAPLTPAPPIDSPPSKQILSGFITDIEFVGKNQIAAADDEGNLACVDLLNRAYRRWRRDKAFWTRARWENEDQLTVFSSKLPARVHSWNGAPPVNASFPVETPLGVVTSADGELQAAFNRSGELSLADTATGKTRFLVRSHRGNVEAEGAVTLTAAISSDNALVYTTGQNNRLTAWKTADGTVAWEEPLTDTGRVILEDPATRRLFVGGDFDSLRVYDGRTGKLLTERGGGNGAMCLTIDSVNGRLISGHCDGTLRIQDLDLAVQESINRSYGNELTAVTLSPDGRVILSGDADGIIRVWHADGQLLGSIYRTARTEPRVHEFLWSPSGEQLAVLISGSDGTSEIIAWKLPRQ